MRLTSNDLSGTLEHPYSFDKEKVRRVPPMASWP
jgi:hypothetical protein